MCNALHMQFGVVVSLSPHARMFLQLPQRLKWLGSLQVGTRPPGTWTMRQVGRRGMCQVCWHHRSEYRRECIGCHCLVAPGCYPEDCLYRDYGLFTGLCRPCGKKVLQQSVKRLAATLPQALTCVAASSL